MRQYIKALTRVNQELYQMIQFDLQLAQEDPSYKCYVSYLVVIYYLKYQFYQHQNKVHIYNAVFENLWLKVVSSYIWHRLYNNIYGKELQVATSSNFFSLHLSHNSPLQHLAVP